MVGECDHRCPFYLVTVKCDGLPGLSLGSLLHHVQVWPRPWDVLHHYVFMFADSLVWLLGRMGLAWIAVGKLRNWGNLDARWSFVHVCCGVSFSFNKQCINFYVILDFLIAFVSLTFIILCLPNIWSAGIRLYFQAVPRLSSLVPVTSFLEGSQSLLSNMDQNKIIVGKNLDFGVRLTWICVLDLPPTLWHWAGYLISLTSVFSILKSRDDTTASQGLVKDDNNSV